jgi:hypothetical protein
MLAAGKQPGPPNSVYVLHGRARGFFWEGFVGPVRDLVPEVDRTNPILVVAASSFQRLYDGVEMEMDSGFKQL